MSDAGNRRPAKLRAIYQLLQSGAYEQAADMLHNVQSTVRLTAAYPVRLPSSPCAKSAWPACNARRKSSGTARQVKQLSGTSNN